jgi:Tol biopolymer transport system component
MRSKSAVLVIVALIITVLACDVPTIPTLPPIINTVLSDETLATDVVATLEALISGTPEVTVAPEPPPCTTASVLTIAYTNNGNVWLIEGTNPPLQLTSGGNADGVAISGDGQKVAFTTWNPPTQTTELRAVNSDGTGETVLMSQADLDALPPGLGSALHNAVHRMQFKPCTQDLLFNTRAIFEGPGLATHNNLLEMDTSSGILTVILSPGSSGAGFFISPDGSKLALSHHDKIEFANIDGSGLIPSAHTYTPVITYSEFLWNPPVQWAPDSSAVGLAMPSQDPFAPGAYGDIWLIQADGSGAAHMATIVADFYQIQVKEITISPNLSSLAYLRDSATPNIEDIYFSNFDGSGETLYDTADVKPAGWSPDSINYAYVVTTPGGNELRIGRMGYTPAVQTTTTNIMRNVSWADDTRLLFFDGSNPTWTLKLTQLGSGTFTLDTITGTTLPVYDFAPKP